MPWYSSIPSLVQSVSQPERNATLRFSTLLDAVNMITGNETYLFLISSATIAPVYCSPKLRSSSFGLNRKSNNTQSGLKFRI